MMGVDQPTQRAQQHGATLIDVDELLRNWADYVHWGSDGKPRAPTLCISYEKHFVDNLSRFQYASPPPRPKEPRFDDGARVERIVTHPDFPTVWRRVLIVEYLRTRYRPAGLSAEDWLQTKARLSRVSSRSYHDLLDGARSFIHSRYFLLAMSTRPCGY